MATRATVAFAAWAVVLCGSGSVGLAHQQTATFGGLSQVDGPNGDATVSWRLRVRTADLMAALRLSQGLGMVASLPDWRRRAEGYLRAGVHVSVGRPCGATTSTLSGDATASEPTLVFVQQFTCPGGAGPLRLRYDLFFEIDRFHQSFTLLQPSVGWKAAGAPTASSIVFRDGAREAIVGSAEDASPWASVLRYLKLGVVHILTGYDHLSFLMALLLAAGLQQRSGPGKSAVAASGQQAIRRTITVISAFTVAHSLTLIGQVLRPGSISTRWVEPAIAFSVAFVGFDNLVPRTPRFRFPLVFGFGLVHGLGFASVLREIGLPRRGLLLSLVSFNVGVEVGQLSVLTLAFPIILAAAHRSPRNFERWGLKAGSALIAVFGTIWLVSRLAMR